MEAGRGGGGALRQGAALEGRWTLTSAATFRDLPPTARLPPAAALTLTRDAGHRSASIQLVRCYKKLTMFQPLFPPSVLTRAHATIALKSPNYFPHLTKAAARGPGASNVSQMRVAGAPLRGRDRAPRSSMSDPEALSLRSAVAAAGPDLYARHTSWSDPTTAMLDAGGGGWGRAPVAPGVVVAEGGPAVSTPDVPHPVRASIHDPAYVDSVKTRLS